MQHPLAKNGGGALVLTGVVGVAALVAWTALRDPQSREQVAADGTRIVPLAKSDVTRRAPITADVSVAKLLVQGLPVEHLTHGGVLAVDGRADAIYLPDAKEYSIVNRGTREDEFGNTSTLLAIDADGDGTIDESESWYADLPVRIGDRVFDVTAIAPDGSSISLKPAAGPLRGVIVGRTLPPFEWKLADGTTISDRSLRGKPLVLDIWSVT
jgi:hypothetical protein